MGVESWSEHKLNRFWSKVSKTKSGCWEWTGWKNQCGYGCLEIKGKEYRAHRLSYELHYKKSPDMLQVLHKCDNPCCINPEHLFLGTQADNVRDMVEKKRGVNLCGEKHGMSKLYPELVRYIRTSPLSEKELGKQLKISPSAIGNARRGVTWKHIQ